MRLKTQSKVLSTLEMQTRKALRDLEDAHCSSFLGLWENAKKELELIVMREYRQDFGREKWDVVKANSKGTLQRILYGASHVLGSFQQTAENVMSSSLSTMREEEIVRGMWMLDVTTPPSYQVSVPIVHYATRESKTPRQYKANWNDALATWVKAYEDSLAANLRLEALHEGSLSDATDEVNSTTIDSFDPSNKFQSLFTSETMRVQDEAREDVAAANNELVADEVWLTLEDTRVCYECEGYDGKSISEIGLRPPAHFNCRCYTSIVPVEWSELLSSGDAENKRLALRMEDMGLIPAAMAVFDGDKIKGTVAVDFNSWRKNKFPMASGRFVTR